MKKIISLLLCLIVCSFSLAGCVDGHSLSLMVSQTSSSEEQLTIQFLNVGQADCELLILPGNRAMLIDAGNNNDGGLIVDYLNSLEIKKLDYVVCTHPHDDHIGGMDDVITNFEIGQLYIPAFSKDDTPTTKAYESVLEAADKKGLEITTAKVGLQILSEQDLDIHMVAPNSTDYDGNLNNYSAVIYMKYFNTVALFMGDAEDVSEKEIMKNGYDIDADILKVGHHGSSTSSTKKFISQVSPKISVISCGKNNSYNHPNDSTLVTLKNAGSEVFRTDIDGTVEIKIDKNGYSTPNKLPDVMLDGGD